MTAIQNLDFCRNQNSVVVDAALLPLGSETIVDNNEITNKSLQLSPRKQKVSRKPESSHKLLDVNVDVVIAQKRILSVTPGHHLDGNWKPTKVSLNCRSSDVPSTSRVVWSLGRSNKPRDAPVKSDESCHSKKVSTVPNTDIHHVLGIEDHNSLESVSQHLKDSTIDPPLCAAVTSSNWKNSSKKEPESDYSLSEIQKPHSIKETQSTSKNNPKWSVMEIRKISVQRNTNTSVSTTDKESKKTASIPCPHEGCNALLSSSTALRKHRVIHKEKSHVCEICQKAFVQASKLKRHMLVHSGQKSFKCPEEGCEKEFSLQHNLNAHVRIHKGERPFHCSICGKAFVQSNNMKDHEKTHLKKKNE